MSTTTKKKTAAVILNTGLLKLNVGDEGEIHLKYPTPAQRRRFADTIRRAIATKDEHAENRVYADFIDELYDHSKEVNVTDDSGKVVKLKAETFCYVSDFYKYTMYQELINCTVLITADDVKN